MNPPIHLRTSRLPTWQFASGALFALLVAFSGAAGAARIQGKQVATLVPVNAPSTTAAAQPPAPAIFGQAQSESQPASSLALESLGPGDMVRISVFRNPELTTETRVSERGTVLFPMIGEVPVGGLSPSQAGTRIGEKLKQGRFVVNPEVTVSLFQVNSRQVAVLGNVNKPGRYPLDTSTARLLDLLAVAGGISPTGADLVSIVTTRDGKTSKMDVDLPGIIRTGDLSKNIELQAGDTVFVHRAPMVYIYGEVQKSGAYRLEPEMTVMQAIAVGGGITPRGTERGIKISRRNGDGQVHRIDARLTDKVQVDDVIHVRESIF